MQLYEKRNKDSGSDGRGDSGWNLEIQLDLGFGVCSMSLVLDKNRVSLACWVPDQSLYQKIHNNEHVLKSKLFDQGLELLSFELHDFAKIRSPIGDTGSESTYKVRCLDLLVFKSVSNAGREKKAVALLYSDLKTPVLTAKGENQVAWEIIESAQKNGVIVAEDPVLQKRSPT